MVSGGWRRSTSRYRSFSHPSHFRTLNLRLSGGTKVKGHSHSRNADGFLHSLGSAKLLKIFCCVALVLCLPFLASAQDTGSISGTVTDKSGAAIAGAALVITSTAGSLTRATTTNNDGAFVAGGLPG